MPMYPIPAVKGPSLRGGNKGSSPFGITAGIASKGAVFDTAVHSLRNGLKPMVVPHRLSNSHCTELTFKIYELLIMFVGSALSYATSEIVNE